MTIRTPTEIMTEVVAALSPCQLKAWVSYVTEEGEILHCRLFGPAGTRIVRPFGIRLGHLRYDDGHLRGLIMELRRQIQVMGFSLDDWSLQTG